MQAPPNRKEVRFKEVSECVGGWTNGQMERWRLSGYFFPTQHPFLFLLVMVPLFSSSDHHPLVWLS